MLQGFESDIFDSQTVFRNLLSAMANPGRVMDMGVNLSVPEDLTPAAGAVLLTLLDEETPLWSDLENRSREIQWLRFHTGAPYTRVPENAAFALCADDSPLTDSAVFNRGTLAAPQTSTTLVVPAKGIDNNGRIRLTGPGVETETFLKLEGVADAFLTKRAEICAKYPLGFDTIFVYDRLFVAIPRTTTMEIL